MKYTSYTTVILLFVALGLSGVFGLAQTTHAATKDVVLIGSSSFARGCSRSYGFVNVLRKKVGDIFDCSYPKTGNGSAGFGAQWNKAKSSGNKYTMLFYYAGWNGMNTQTSFDNYQNTMKTIIAEAKSMNMKVVGVSAQHNSKEPKKKFIRDNNATLRSLADIYIPFGESIDRNNNDKIDTIFTHDGIHANEAGNEILADLILERVFKIADATVKVDTAGVPFINEIDIILQKPTPKITIPGLIFTDADTLKKTTQSGNTYVHSPFLAEYITSIYRYLIIVVSVVGAAMIIHAGFVWVLSGGSTEKITQARTKIVRTGVGITIAVLSYTILSTINPNLVNFRSLQILLVQQQQYPIPEEPEGASDEDYNATSSLRPECKVAKPKWNMNTFDCTIWKNGGYEPQGTMPASCVVTYKCPGIVSTLTTIPEMKDAMCKVGKLALDRGYLIRIGGASFRSFETQAKFWCESTYTNLIERSKNVAVPGTSNHGLGIAVDAYLYTDTKKPLMEVNTKTQCRVKQETVEAIAKLFYDADPRFERLSTEIWHFTFRLNGAKAERRKTEFPHRASCLKKNPRTNM